MFTIVYCACGLYVSLTAETRDAATLSGRKLAEALPGHQIDIWQGDKLLDSYTHPL
jgi:hypothetical protein